MSVFRNLLVFVVSFHAMVTVVHMVPLPSQQSSETVIYDDPQHQDPTLGQAFEGENESESDGRTEMALRLLETIVRLKQSGHQDEEQVPNRDLIWESLWKNAQKPKRPPHKKTQMCHFKICNMRGKRSQ